MPAISVSQTWERIISVIAPSPDSSARRELTAIAGVACSCIADEALADDPLVIQGTGPRLRVYVLYGDDAVDGEAANESSLSWVPTDGDWRMSIPCLADDLEWVRRSLVSSSTRVTARAVGTPMEGGEDDEDRSRADAGTGPTVDRGAFFRL